MRIPLIAICLILITVACKENAPKTVAQELIGRYTVTCIEQEWYYGYCAEITYQDTIAITGNGKIVYIGNSNIEIKRNQQYYEQGSSRFSFTRAELPFITYYQREDDPLIYTSWYYEGTKIP